MKKLGFCICKTNIGTQKIDNNGLETYEMVFALFQMNNKDRKSHFFEETFLLADININVAFGMFFFTLSNVKVNCNNRKF